MSSASSEGEAKDNLLEAVLAGIDVSRRLAKRCQTFPRSIEVFIDMVKETLSLDKPYEIHFHPRCYQASAFIGSIHVSDSRSDIFYNFDISTCWRRFIVAKEMSHLLFAPHGEKHLVSTPEQIEQLIINLLAGFDNVAVWKDHAVSTEYCTILIALETLLPHGERKHIAKGNTLEIATRYRVPEQMVKLYFTSKYENLMEHGYSLAPNPID